MSTEGLEQAISRARRPAKQIRATTSRLADAVREARRRFEYWEGLSNRYAAEHLQAKYDEVHADFVKEYRKVRKEGERQLEKARKATEPPGLPRDPGAAMLLERQKERAWGRIRPMLEADRDPTEVAKRLADEGDRPGVEALIEELPAFLDARGNVDAESSDYRDRRIREAMAAVREHHSAVLTPEERAAHEGLAEAEKAHSTLETNLGFLKSEGIEVATLYGEDGEGFESNVDLQGD
jgi:hypothetical protein